MMVIEGKEAIARVDWRRVRTIVAEAGLNERDVQQLEQAFRQSTFCWFGYENGQLIAVARAISDCTRAATYRMWRSSPTDRGRVTDNS